MQLYDSSNAVDMDSFSTHSGGTKGQPHCKGEGNCWSEYADIGFKLTTVVGLGP
jgi:hypothetical protein